MKIKIAKIIHVLFLFVFVYLQFLQSSYAADILVTTNDDLIDSKGDCSIREAVEAANRSKISGSIETVDECIADQSSELDGIFLDNIYFDDGIEHITITGVSKENFNVGGDIDIESNLNIVGPESKVTFDGNFIDRVFEVERFNNVSFENVIIENGRVNSSFPRYYAGAIFSSYSTLNIRNSIIRNNEAYFGAAIFYNLTDGLLENVVFESNYNNPGGGGSGIINHGGNLDITDSIFQNNGITPSSLISSLGAVVYNNEGDINILRTQIIDNKGYSTSAINVTSGNINIDSSTISGNGYDNLGNVATADGAIFNLATLTISNSIIEDNVSQDYAGAIYNMGDLKINSSLIGNNSSNDSSGLGGAIYNSGSLDLLNSTLGNNLAYKGSALYNIDGQVTINFSTLAENISTEGGVIFNDVPTLSLSEVKVKSSILDLNTPSNCSNFDSLLSLGFNITNDDSCRFFNTNDQTSESLLGMLQDNGGETYTYLPMASSLALNNSTNCTTIQGDALEKDQRNTTRPQGTHCDSGAVELDDSEATIFPSVTLDTARKGKSRPAYRCTPFEDVSQYKSKDNYSDFCRSIDILKQKNIVRGVMDGKFFDKDSNITVGQISSILVRALNLSEENNNCVLNIDLSSEHARDFCTLYNLKIIEKDEYNLDFVNTEISYDEMSKVFVKLKNLEYIISTDGISEYKEFNQFSRELAAEIVFDMIVNNQKSRISSYDFSDLEK